MKKFKRIIKKYYKNEIEKIKILEYKKIRSNIIIIGSDKNKMAISLKNFIFNMSGASVMFFLFFLGFIYRSPLQSNIKEFYINNKIEKQIHINNKQINSILLRIQKKYKKEI